MNLKEEEAEIKKEFQLERVILFTDAVFAIILTIMVLDLKLPEGIRHDEVKIKDGFDELVLKLVGYMVTFGLVARFWVIHLKLFRYLKDYDTRLIIYNLLFLFSASLFPFAVSLVAGTISPRSPEYSWGWAAYVIVFCTTTFVQTLICQYLIKKKETLCIDIPHIETIFKWKVQRLNFVLTPLVIIMVIILLYNQASFNLIQYTVIFYGVLVGLLIRKYYPDDKNSGPLIMRVFRPVKRKKQPELETAKVKAGTE